MEIEHITYKRCDLVKVKGRLDSASAPEFDEKLKQITNSGRYRIVIDMGDLQFISSAGLRALISAQKVCRRYNRGEVVLTNVPENIKAALDLAGFTRLFKIYPDVVSAVANV
ncbi:STAS domain-containing protein [Thermanaerothrix sp.]|jgi:anti-sigma B factor antagonist|uniref:STAS domain-containing protein n=1 Tax=Thermanaerothrix sp. TaxID=2972675 RepID=UPI002ADDF138|nr:STAS domain-containing protein [Thermanaerothrix sp.]